MSATSTQTEEKVAFEDGQKFILPSPNGSYKKYRVQKQPNGFLSLQYSSEMGGWEHTMERDPARYAWARLVLVDEYPEYPIDTHKFKPRKQR